MAKKSGSLVSYGIALTVMALSSFAILNAQEIRDWWQLRDYSPSAEIARLADRAQLSARGERLFFVGDPKLNDKQEFNSNCPTTERSLVLGCYSSGYIYILAVDDPRLDGIEEVTAAHEMLHAAYDRLDGDERERVDGLLLRQFNEITDERILSLIEQYRSQDPSSVNNELHSILPTEYADLSPELEEYYSQYFVDRLAVVALADSYEAAFSSVERRVETLTTRIEAKSKEIQSSKVRADGLSAQFADLSQEVKDTSAELDRLNEELDELESQGRTAQYNQMVVEYNLLVEDLNASTEALRSLQRQYNALVDQINADIKEHNRLVEARRQLSYRGMDLYRAIDSTYQDL